MLLFCVSKQLFKNHLKLLFIKRSLIVINNSIECNVCNNKLLFNNKYINNNYYLINSRLYCDKKLQTINNEKQVSDKKQKGIEINYETIPKRNKYFELILKKPNELINWYKTTPPKRRRNYYISYFIKFGFYNFAFICFLSLIFMYNYLEENPLTGRKALYNMPKELIVEIEEQLLMNLIEKYEKSNSFIPSTNNYVKRLDKCVERLLAANEDIEGLGGKVWTPVVVDDDNVCDVVVYEESGHIIVFKKMLDLCQTDDELAYVLAHQLSHMLLKHKTEPVSYLPFIAIPIVTVLPKIYEISKPEEGLWKPVWMSTVDDFFINYFKNWIIKYMEFSAFSDELEEEADRICLQLMTRSCFDVRVSPKFCQLYKHLSEVKDEKDFNNYFTKHPINDNKIKYIKAYMNPFILLREKCDCEPLV